MRKLTWVLLAFILTFSSIPVFSQPPDPRDSVILESKTVAPGAYPGPASDTAAYLYVKVYITNKDSLASMTLPVEVTSTSGGAYAILARPRNFSGVVTPLANTLHFITAFGSNYHSNSPDSFIVSGAFDPEDWATIEPPNATRKAFWELKFDTVWTAAGTFELDSSAACCQSIGFVTVEPKNLTVNFVKGVITVASKGDLNLDFALTASDVTLILNSVFLGDAPPAGLLACDLNCDGMRTSADVVLELNAVFLYRALLCQSGWVAFSV